MITHRIPRAARRAAVTGATLAIGLGLPLLAAPAFAEDPASWPKAPHVSGFDFLVVLFLIPAGLAILITLVVSLPSMIRGDSGNSAAEAWRGGGEWFGGPSKGVDAPPADKEPGAGGASGTW